MRKIITLTLSFTLSIIILLFASIILTNYFSDNFHVVIKNKVYRSAQLRPKKLEHYIQTLGLKSIINLRDDAERDPNYKKEREIAEKYHLLYINVRLSSQKLPDLSYLKQLVKIIDTAPKPTLIHCKAGADRTGLAAAISILLEDGQSVDEVEDQMSWHYNVYSPYSIGYQTIKNYLDWLQKTHKKNTQKNFLEWLDKVEQLKSHAGWFLT
ncbi:MAG: tyrosine-protein phosphatase [Gammaproteobacteria bacterium]|nr:tyrosine-protein phosphatase [Gammaproteobacteria bacterium]